MRLLPSRSQTVTAAFTLAVTATLLGIQEQAYVLTSKFASWSPPSNIFEEYAYLRVIVLFVLTVVVIRHRSRTLSVILFMATLAQVPLFVSRAGYGVLDQPEIVKIEYAVFHNVSGDLFGISALLFTVSSFMLLFTVRWPHGRTPASP